MVSTPRPSGGQLRARLRELGLLAPGAKEKTLLALCHAQRLRGGISVSLRATPDEVLGQLGAALGGPAAKLRLEEVKGTGPFELHVRCAHGLERWEVDDVPALVCNLNSLFSNASTVRACAVLGEWEDMLQLWCLDRLRLLTLLAEPWFAPLNRPQLERLAGLG